MPCARKGWGDVSVGKKMRKLGEAVYGRMNALMKRRFGTGDAVALAEAMARNIYADPQAEHAAALADYALASRSALGEQDFKAVLAIPAWAEVLNEMSMTHPFSDVVRINQIGAGLNRRLEPDAEARRRIARSLDLQGLEDFVVDLEIKPTPSTSEWDDEGAGRRPRRPDLRSDVGAFAGRCGPALLDPTG